MQIFFVYLTLNASLLAGLHNLDVSPEKLQATVLVLNLSPLRN